MRCMIAWGSIASLAARPGSGATPSTIITHRDERHHIEDICLLHRVETVARHPAWDRHLAYLIAAPLEAGGVSAIIGAGCRLGLLLGLLVPTGLTRQAHGSPHSGSDGCSLPGI